MADAECRALCEGPYDYDGYNYLEYNADLFQAIAGACLRASPACLPRFLPPHPRTPPSPVHTCPPLLAWAPRATCRQYHLKPKFSTSGNTTENSLHLNLLPSPRICMLKIDLMVIPCLCFLSDHYIQVLSCKQNCVTELASHPSREKPFEDFLPSHYNYLQFAYYNSKAYFLPSLPLPSRRPKAREAGLMGAVHISVFGFSL